MDYGHMLLSFLKCALLFYKILAKKMPFENKYHYVEDYWRLALSENFVGMID